MKMYRGDVSLNGKAVCEWRVCCVCVVVDSVGMLYMLLRRKWYFHREGRLKAQLSMLTHLN